MENDSPYASKRDRLMGKLFKVKEKDKKSPTDSAASLDAFLRSSSDNLNVTHPPPPLPLLPKLAKLDTTISRYPQALGVNKQAQQNQPMALGRTEPRSPQRGPRPNRKGLMVRFADSYPEVIGEGGEETELPTIEISKKKRARPPPSSAPSALPPPTHRGPLQPTSQGRGPSPLPESRNPFDDDDFQPKPLMRTQTGFSSIYEPEPEEKTESYVQPKTSPPPYFPRASPEPTSQLQPQDPLVPGRAASARFLDTTGRHDDARKSFIEIHQAQMREAEGQAFVKAARTASATISEHDWVDGDRPPSDSIDCSLEQTRSDTVSPEYDSDLVNVFVSYSPAGSIKSNASSHYEPSASAEQPSQYQQVPQQGPQQVPNFSRQPSEGYRPEPASMHRANTIKLQNSAPPPQMLRSLSTKLHDVVIAAGDDALQTFVSRTRHLFELFRLHAESVRPLSTCGLKECARAGIWWFLKGRMNLETTIRERPTTPNSQMQNELNRQQAYTNLSKGYWLCEEVIPEIAVAQGLPPDAEIVEVSQSLVSALKKLAMSMKRNGILPPEDAFLPQTIDKSIWIEYPPLSQDMIALLSGNWTSGLSAMQHPMSTLHLLDAFPLGDTPENFSYGRVFADVFLMEQGREAQRLFFPSVLSMVRPQKHSGLVYVISSQNGNLQLAIQGNKNAGPVWDDVRWRNENCNLEVRLPRGFMLIIQVTQQDYRMLWNMYDFGAKVKATLYPRKDELLVSRNTLKSFQYIDGDPQARMFPKEAVAQCDVALFENIHKQISGAATRNWHRGFRIAVVTGPKTRTVSGVHHMYPPYMPIQFGFFRTEGDAPALSLRFESGRQKGRMVLTFGEENERIKFHALLTGTALDHDEKVFADVPMKSFMISQSIREPLGISPFSRMPWKAARIVNEDLGPEGEPPETVLSDKLKIVLEYQNGTLTDRVNVGPGELRVRLEVQNAKMLRVLRQPQNDISMSVSEAQVPKELPRNLSDAMQLLRMNQTIRTFEFNNLQDLHDFQYSLTGYEVVFDGLAATFAIARRRMVVPIHKKWEAGYTRVQVVKNMDKLQLLAFFEDFHHGHCMNFVLKGTDVYESFHRSGKAGIKFVDAKFPLPRMPADKDGDYDDMAFVCLDLPDLPGEHDDITLLFEKEEDRDRLIGLLPAPVKGSARMSSRLK